MDMDFADFIEKIWNCRLLEYQKKLIREVEKHPDKYSIKLLPLSREKQVRIMLVEKTEHKDIPGLPFIHIIATKELRDEPNNED